MQVWRVIVGEDMRRGRFTGPMVDAPCALGRNGCIAEADKREGDGKTPLGTYPLRQVFYRPERMSAPVCALPKTPLSPEMGWCDDEAHTQYNQLVQLPFVGSHEKMWRDDGLYDAVVVLGHNDEPVVKGHGSAIFIHIAKPDLEPTEGCVALSRSNLLSFLKLLRAGDVVQIG